MTDELTRRRFVVTTGAVAGAAALAGCGGSSGGDGGDGGDGGSDGGSDGSDGSDGSSGGSTTVEMNDQLKYSPDSLEIEVGTTVTWENVGAVGHTVTAYEDSLPDGAEYFASGGFDSQDAAVEGYNNGQEGNVTEGETYEHTFETPGEYEYYCIPHEMNGMKGTITVVE
jgi:plastocyanin